MKRRSILSPIWFVVVALTITTNVNAERGVTIESPQIRTTTIGLGGEVIQLKGEVSDEWTQIGTIRIAPVQFIERDNLGEGVPTKDWSTIGGAALAWVKGDKAISVSFLGTLQSFEDSERLAKYGWLVDTSSTQDYYFADVRYHRVISENMSSFFGYKVGSIDWKWTEYRVGGPYYYEEDGLTIAHGPLVGINIFRNLKDTSFSLWGSVAFMPIGLAHWDLDSVEDGTTYSESDTEPAWFVNPEFGVRWKISETSSASFGWLWHLMGDYSDGAGEIVHGLTASLSYKF
ncbi:hypothetical protein KA005_76355 [bacterium]|nr:hypothetical protein [bacterium]